jgi:hypothetical protein
MQPAYEQQQDAWPTTLKNLMSAYIIVNELQLVVPAGVLAADYRVYKRTGDIDTSWLGTWFEQQQRQPMPNNHSKNMCCFVKSMHADAAQKYIKKSGPNTVSLQFLAHVIIEELVIAKCRYEPPEQVTVDRLLAAWDTYCYFAETNQLGMLITAHLLGADDIVIYEVNRERSRA